ncbi:hypothetical protein [Dyella subtropica]|uniref:hypothetical protein n=1 Tax=Dyella subtropica TaxID=2992127 RepID=UPI0022530296|nr:hypothetical protein [Dyella subtropica]
MSSLLKRKIPASSFLSNFPAPAALKHFAESVSNALAVTANRKRISRINTVIDPSLHYESGEHHYVGGRTWNVIAGPRSKNGKLAFLTVEDKGYQLDKFKNTGVGHRDGPANALALYVKRVRALTVWRPPSTSTKFPK